MTTRDTEATSLRSTVEMDGDTVTVAVDATGPDALDEVVKAAREAVDGIDAAATSASIDVEFTRGGREDPTPERAFHPSGGPGDMDDSNAHAEQDDPEPGEPTPESKARYDSITAGSTAHGAASILYNRDGEFLTAPEVGEAFVGFAASSASAALTHLNKLGYVDRTKVPNPSSDTNRRLMASRLNERGIEMVERMGLHPDHV